MPPNLERDTRPVIHRELMAGVMQTAAECGLEDLSPSQLICYLLRQWLQSIPRGKTGKATSPSTPSRLIPPSNTDDLGVHEQKMLALLADMASDDGCCGPIGFKNLAKSLSISPNFAKRLIQRLIDAQYLEVLSPRVGSRGARYNVTKGTTTEKQSAGQEN